MMMRVQMMPNEAGSASNAERWDRKTLGSLSWRVSVNPQLSSRECLYFPAKASSILAPCSPWGLQFCPH